MNLDQIIFLQSDISKDNHILEKETNDFIQNLNIDELSFPFPLFFIKSGGSEEKFVQIYNDYKEPYYFIATDKNNSLASALEIISFLNQKGLKNHLFHGTYSQISNQIKNFKDVKPSFNYELKNHLNLLYGYNLGVIGKPSDWLIASSVDYKKAKDIFGVNLIDIPFPEFLKAIEDSVDENVNLNKFNLKSNKIISDSELKKAFQIYNALKKLVFKYNLKGLTLRCFDLLSSYHSTGCLALSLLNNEGIISSCEGDIPSLLSMLILAKGMKKLSFQCNPSYINIDANYGYFAHCTIPTKLTTSFTFTTHFESGIGVAIKGKLKKQKVTIFKLDPSLNHFVVYKGYIEDNLSSSSLCRTQIKVHFYNPVDELLSSPLGNHLLISYGDFSSSLIKLIAK